MKINYVEKDITTSDATLIIHQVHCQRAMNGGVAKAIKTKWSKVYDDYMSIQEQTLGDVQFIKVEAEKYVANMFAQDKYGYNGYRYTSYDALDSCLRKVAEYCKNNMIDKIALPMFMSCDRGGASWRIVLAMIEDAFFTNDIEIEILYQKFYENKSSSENNYSVCFIINQNNKHFLFTGDLEEDGEESLVESNTFAPASLAIIVNLYKAGHHGSNTSSHDTLLNVIKPEIVVVQAVAGNFEYAKNEVGNVNVDGTFPTTNTLKRIAKHTSKVYVTSLGITEQNEDGTFKLDILNTMQTPALFALKNELVTGKARENMIMRLRENFRQHGNCLQTGFLGTSILMSTLTI